MAMIRPAELADVKLVLTIAEAQARRLPSLRPDASKMRALAIDCISSAQNFAWVSEDGGQVTGVLFAMSYEILWAERKGVSALLWYSDSKGEGMAMLREFARWVRSRRAVKMADFSPMCDWDSRIDNLLIRAGFSRSGGSFILFQ